MELCDLQAVVRAAPLIESDLPAAGHSRSMLNPKKDGHAVGNDLFLLEVPFHADRVADLQVGRGTPAAIEPSNSRNPAHYDRISITMKSNHDRIACYCHLANLALESNGVATASGSGDRGRTLDRTNVCQRGHGE